MPGKASKPTASKQTRATTTAGTALATEKNVATVVATAHIDEGTVTLKPNKLGPVRVRPGQLLHVKLTYRLQEASSDKEEYRFHLRCNMDGQRPDPALARHGDAWGLPEDIMGAIVQTFKVPKVGNHNLEFQAGAEYIVASWDGESVKRMERREITGTILVRVES